MAGRIDIGRHPNIKINSIYGKVAAIVVTTIVVVVAIFSVIIALK